MPDFHRQIVLHPFGLRQHRSFVRRHWNLNPIKTRLATPQGGHRTKPRSHGIWPPGCTTKLSQDLRGNWQRFVPKFAMSDWSSRICLNDPNGHTCCAAQMFLNEGDGVVFRGANGPWKTADFEYHLKRLAAKKLLPLCLRLCGKSRRPARRTVYPRTDLFR